MRQINFSKSLIILLLACRAWSAEESLDLEKEAVTAQKVVTQLSQIKIMGRVDLTAEYYPLADKSGNDFKNYHFFLFLKVPASPKVSLMGEVLTQAFYDMTYRPWDLVHFHFGKIIVPFGDTTYYHHFYGGLQGYGTHGVMFPNIWAEHGMNVQWNFEPLTVETYVVNGISSPTVAENPDFNASSNKQNIAGGFRATTHFWQKVKLIASLYDEEWLPGKPLYIVGGDAVSEYGLMDVPVLRNLRLAAGRAVGYVKSGVQGDYQKAGDYLQLATNAMSFAEFRLRYGTYIDNSAIKTAADTHSINAGLSIPIDVMKLLAEYQWNFEAINEVPNDVARLMLSLDF
jgi:hypothetical protein